MSLFALEDRNVYSPDNVLFSTAIANLPGACCASLGVKPLLVSSMRNSSRPPCCAVTSDAAVKAAATTVTVKSEIVSDASLALNRIQLMCRKIFGSCMLVTILYKVGSGSD